MIWEQRHSLPTVSSVPPLWRLWDAPVHGTGLQTGCAPVQVFVLAQGARHIKSDLWFVAAVLLYCVCCHFKALLRLLKCSQGPFVPGYYFLNTPIQCLFSCCGSEFFEMFLGPTHSWLLKFKSLTLVAVPQNFPDPLLFSKISVFLLCFSFTLTLLLHSQHFRWQWQVQIVPVLLTNWLQIPGSSDSPS